MINVFNYLNYFDPSKTRFLVVPILNEMKNPALSDAQLDGKIREAFEKTSHPLVPLEYAEIKIHCAMAMYSRKRYYEAKILLDEALANYETDPHRRAVALWMNGVNSLTMQDVSIAYDNWYSARSILEEILAGRLIPIARPDKQKWYQARLLEINNVMASNCIQEIYRWYDYFDPNSIDNQTMVFGERIFKTIASHKNIEAKQLIDCLLRLSKMNNNMQQLREVYVICGMAQYMMGDLNDALHYFKEVMNMLEKKSHRLAVIYWLNGMVQWRNPVLREAALVDFRTAIELFKELALESDKKHRVNMLTWYREKLVFMESEYKRKESVIMEGFA